MTSASTSTPRKPTGSISRSTSSRRSAFDPELSGWNGLGFVIQAYGKRCPFVVDWLIDLARRSRPPADDPPGQGRLLGFGDQARPGRRSRRVSGLHPQGLHRRVLSRLRAQIARGAGCGLPAIRHPQCADARVRPRLRRARLLSRPVRVPVPARHGRAALRGGGRPRQARIGRAAFTRRSARTRPCSPISFAACSRTAPTPRS